MNTMQQETMHNNTALIIDDDVQGTRWQQWVESGSVEQGLLALFTLLDQTPLAAAPVCIRFASNSSVQQLNALWRNKDAVTDVLSFPMQDAPDFLPQQPLGDIVLAVPLIDDAATSLALTVEDHAMHLIIHGMLHLLGYDHQDDAEACMMQSLECQCMQRLGLHNPYPDNV